MVKCSILDRELELWHSLQLLLRELYAPRQVDLLADIVVRLLIVKLARIEELFVSGLLGRNMKNLAKLFVLLRHILQDRVVQIVVGDLAKAADGAFRGGTCQEVVGIDDCAFLAIGDGELDAIIYRGEDLEASGEDDAKVVANRLIFTRIDKWVIGVNQECVLVSIHGDHVH